MSRSRGKNCRLGLATKKIDISPKTDKSVGSVTGPFVWISTQKAWYQNLDREGPGRLLLSLTWFMIVSYTNNSNLYNINTIGNNRVLEKYYKTPNAYHRWPFMIGCYENMRNTSVFIIKYKHYTLVGKPTRVRIYIAYYISCNIILLWTVSRTKKKFYLVL